MIEIQALRKAYGTKAALDGVSLAVERGEVVGLLGPNGAGKSTMMKCAVGLVHPDAGTVRLDGVDLRRDKRRALARMGFVPQRVAFPEHHTVAGVLAFYAAMKGLAPEAVEQALARVGMAAHRNLRVGTLSGGMLQRLGLAQALLADPPILILDEPTVGLDPHVSLAFRDLLAQLNAGGTTILISSHVLSEVERLAHRVAILKEGRLIAVDTIDRLLSLSGLPAYAWIRPKGDADRARASLAAAGLAVTLAGGALQVAEADGVTALNALQQQDIAIEAFWTTTPTLEEVFRWLVEKGTP